MILHTEVFEAVVVHFEEAVYIRWEDDLWYRIHDNVDVKCSPEESEDLEEEYLRYLRMS